MTAAAQWNESLSVLENLDILFAADLEVAATEANAFEAASDAATPASPVEYLKPDGWGEWSAFERRAWLEADLTPEEFDKAKTNAIAVHGPRWTDFQQEVYDATDLEPTEAASLGVERTYIEPEGWANWSYFPRRSYLEKTAKLVEEAQEQAEREQIAKEIEEKRSLTREQDFFIRTSLDSASLAYLSLLTDGDETGVPLFLDSVLIQREKAKGRNGSSSSEISAKVLSHPTVERRCSIIAKCIARERKYCVEIEDLLQEGREALFIVLTRNLYRPSTLPGRFMPWAARVMENRMRNYARWDYRYTVMKARLLGEATENSAPDELAKVVSYDDPEYDADLIAQLAGLTGGREFVREALAGAPRMSKSRRYQFRQRAKALLNQESDLTSAA